MTGPPLYLALQQDAIPIVQSTTDRNARFANPVIGQRVENLGTGFVERWNGTTWLSPDPSFGGTSGGGGSGTGSNPLAGQPGVLGAGFLTVVDTTAHRNALNNVLPFATVFNLQTGNFEIWNGSAWVPFAEGMGGAGTQPPIGFVGPYAASRTSVPWFNVTAFGAIGNGTTGDGPAIQAAISAAASQGGGVVFFPPGRYLGGVSITLAPNVSFFAIRGSAVLVAGGGSIPYFIGNPGGGLGTVVFSGLLFECLTGPAAGMIAINDLTATTLVVRDCEFNIPGATGAVSVTGTGTGGRSVIDRCLIRAVGGTGFTPGAGGVVTDCIVLGASGTAIQATVARGNTVQFTPGANANGIVLVAGGGGPLGSGDSFGKVSAINNVITLNTAGQSNGILCSALSGDVVLQGNEIDQTGGSGIYCANCTGVIVATGNTVKASNANNNSTGSAGVKAGIEFNACTTVQAASNTYVQGSGHALVAVYTATGTSASLVGNIGVGVPAVGNAGAPTNFEQVANVGGYNVAVPGSGLLTPAGVSASVYQGLQLAVVGTGTLVGLTPQSSPALPQTVRATLTGAAATTLPTASTVVGAIMYFKRLDANAGAWTLTANGGDTIDGAATKVCNGQFTVVRLQATATGWDVL